MLRKMLTAPFRTPLEKNSTDFASAMASVVQQAQAKLETMIEAYNSNVG